MEQGNVKSFMKSSSIQLLPRAFPPVIIFLKDDYGFPLGAIDCSTCFSFSLLFMTMTIGADALTS